MASLASLALDLLFLELVRFRGARSGDAGALRFLGVISGDAWVVFLLRWLPCMSALVVVVALTVWVGAEVVLAVVAAAVAEAAMEEAVLVLLGGSALSSEPSERSCGCERWCCWALVGVGVESEAPSL